MRCCLCVVLSFCWFGIFRIHGLITLFGGGFGFYDLGCVCVWCLFPSVCYYFDGLCLMVVVMLFGVCDFVVCVCCFCLLCCVVDVLFV